MSERGLHYIEDDLSETWIEDLAAKGYDVAGSLEELRPDADAAEFSDPDAPDEGDVADAAMDSIVTLLDEAARLRHLEQRLQRDLSSALAELDRSRGLWFRVKRRLVNIADENRVAAAGLAVYRRARGKVPG